MAGQSRRSSLRACVRTYPAAGSSHRRKTGSYPEEGSGGRQQPHPGVEWDRPVSGDTQVAAVINEVRSDGGDVIVSAGGYNGVAAAPGTARAGISAVVRDLRAQDPRLQIDSRVRAMRTRGSPVLAPYVIVATLAADFGNDRQPSRNLARHTDNACKRSCLPLRMTRIVAKRSGEICRAMGVRRWLEMQCST